MSKVFRDFKKNQHMKKGTIVGIIGGIGIFVIIVGITLMFNQESEIMEVEDILDMELRPDENISPEIQEKLDEIKKNAAENEYVPSSREWITSGPFQIDRSEYAIGEKIFIRIGGLQFEEIGQIAVMRPLNATHYSVYLTIPFDGAKKAGFNYYIEPQLSKTRGLCSIDNIMGEWTLVFRGTNYPNLYFDITEKVVPGTNIETVC
jgi:hypothetical protein